jgi:hypothetical protein
MNRFRYRNLVILLIVVATIVGPSTVAAATCPSGPAPPCSPTRFTGSARGQAATCVAPPANCKAQRGKQGARGPRGATGPQGPRGLKGSTGATGPAGPAGPAGGPAGPAGAPGPQGAQGTTGAAGPAGPTGATGATGATGGPGPVGPVGATGATGSNGLAEYAYVYNLNAEVVPIEADITFSTNGVLTAGITHAPGTAGIQIVNAGTYKIAFSVSGVEPSQMAVFENGGFVAGTVYGSGAGTQQNNGQAIIVIAAGDVLTIRNHSSAAAVTLQTLAGGTQTNVNASVTIEKLA